MSSRLSQEMLTATLVTQSVALGPWVSNDAITAWRTHTQGHKLTNTNTVKQPSKKKETFDTPHQYSARLLRMSNDDFMKSYIMHL